MLLWVSGLSLNFALSAKGILTATLIPAHVKTTPIINNIYLNFGYEGGALLRRSASRVLYSL